MTELEIMERAQRYIDCLAKGIDPLTGQPVKDDDVINNVRISRCLFYVSDVLKKVIDNGGEIGTRSQRKTDKAPFALTDEQIFALEPYSERLSAAKITAYINSFVDQDKMKKLTATSVAGWLMQAGFLREITGESGRKRKVPTENGIKLGMKETDFRDAEGVKKYVTYNSNAQQFIFDNIPAIAEVCRQEAEEKAQLKKLRTENKNKP